MSFKAQECSNETPNENTVEAEPSNQLTGVDSVDLVTPAAEAEAITPNDSSNPKNMLFTKMPDVATVTQKLDQVARNVFQPSFKEVESLPFDPKRVYQRSLSTSKKVNRQWVTVEVKERNVVAVYCNVCLAFAKQDSAFTAGLKKFTHVYERIADHEKSKSHEAAVTAFFNAQAEKDIGTLMNREAMGLRKRKVEQNIQVLERILSTIKFIGKQAMPFRGHRNESLYDLTDASVNHGNFLELILLIAQFDEPLKRHVDKVVMAS